MSTWDILQDELDRWTQAGLALPFWWRDDDAIADTPALRQLADMAQAAGVPVTVAVIPARADPSLADYLSRTPHVIPVIHGWAHENHAPPDQKKSEFGPYRPVEVLAQDAELGFGRLHGLFGSRLQPMFVPPWNRIADDLIAELPGLGFRYLSTATPRKARWVAPGLEQVNTHIDPIDWRGTRSLIDETQLLRMITDLLSDRRAGKTDADEPLGLLTHHLVHDPAIWSFCARLVDTLMSGPAVPWTPHNGEPDEPT